MKGVFSYTNFIVCGKQIYDFRNDNEFLLAKYIIKNKDKLNV